MEADAPGCELQEAYANAIQQEQYSRRVLSATLHHPGEYCWNFTPSHWTNPGKDWSCCANSNREAPGCTPGEALWESALVIPTTDDTAIPSEQPSSQPLCIPLSSSPHTSADDIETAAAHSSGSAAEQSQDWQACALNSSLMNVKAEHVREDVAFQAEDTPDQETLFASLFGCCAERRTGEVEMCVPLTTFQGVWDAAVNVQLGAGLYHPGKYAWHFTPGHWKNPGRDWSCCANNQLGAAGCTPLISAEGVFEQAKVQINEKGARIISWDYLGVAADEAVAVEKETADIAWLKQLQQLMQVGDLPLEPSALEHQIRSHLLKVCREEHHPLGRQISRFCAQNHEILQRIMILQETDQVASPRAKPLTGTLNSFAGGLHCLLLEGWPILRKVSLVADLQVATLPAIEEAIFTQLEARGLDIPVLFREYCAGADDTWAELMGDAALIDEPESTAKLPEGALCDAISLLQTISRVKSPLMKLVVVRDACQEIRTAFKDRQMQFGADDLMPLLAHIFVLAAPDHMFSTREMVGAFMPRTLEHGELGYFMVSMFTALACIEQEMVDHSHGQI